MSVQKGPGINEFSIGIATRNGSGSQTANQVVLRAIIAMGVPAGGKNIFPSNISGMPTWFYIRASESGHLARSSRTDLMVCLNAETVAADLAALPPGALVVIDEALASAATRSDLLYLKVPFARLAEEACADRKLQKLVQNMVYVGILGHLLGIGEEETLSALSALLGGKAKAIELNRSALELGRSWARENATPVAGLGLRRGDATKGLILVEGNTATALGAIFAGVTVAAWYPITPSSSVIDDLAAYADLYRRDPASGKLNLAILQMEDEISSAGVVMGAGWAGARAMTATSGPGIDLMGEFVGLGYWTEVPGVFIDVQRTGPSTGLPTHTSQGDIETCAKLGHGDGRHICLYPGNMGECFDFTYQAFDLAERFQTPVFVLSDLDLGMQTWLSEPLVYPDRPFDRGKVLDAAALAKIQDWGRYRDPDGDGIPWRTLPGTAGGKGAYFTRGSGRNDLAQYSEKSADYSGQLLRLARKLEGAKAVLPPPIAVKRGGKTGVLAYGSSDGAVVEALELLAEEGRGPFDYLRVRAYPFSPEVADFVGAYEKVFVVEQNRDGQLANLLKGDFPTLAPRLRSIACLDTLPLSAGLVVEGLRAAMDEGRSS